MQFTWIMMAAAACTSVVASASPDLAHELHGRFHDALLKPRQNTNNLQTFTGALGGIKADAVIETSDSSRPFSVNGSTFTDFPSAAGRSCDNQKNACANMANSGKANFQVSDCETQDNQCKAAITSNVAVTTSSSSSSSSSTSTSSSSSSSSSSTSSTTSTSIASTTSSAQLQLVSQNAEFNFFCEV